MIFLEKYYSSVLTPNGLFCYYKSLCYMHPKSTIYIVSDGTDFERSVFFDELERKLRGYNITCFYPFHSDSINGIYIKKYDTFILSDGGYSKICPLSVGALEKTISISSKRTVTQEEKTEISDFFIKEKNYYKKGVRLMQCARCCKENRNILLSDYLSDDRMINAIDRLLKKIPQNVKKGTPKVKFLSAVSPLGIHTHWDTIFRNYETIIDLQDNMAFSAPIILGVIRDRLIHDKEEFIIIPDLFHKTIPQMILLPQTGVAIIRTDENHILPFSPTHRIITEKFASLPKDIKTKCDLLKEAENNYIEKAVSCIYEGRDNRRSINKLLLPYCNIEKAKETAENIFNEITA